MTMDTSTKIILPIFFYLILTMKFKTTPYHHNLLKDNDRLAVFYEAIKEYDGENKLAYDLGCGSGILSYFLTSKFKEIISLEINEKTYKCACENLKKFNNIQIIHSDILKYKFQKKADLIICEMLDTALIDEEEIPVLNYAKKFLKKDGKIIPEGVINTIQLVNLEKHHLHWDENANYQKLSKETVYSEINFLDDINPKVSLKLSLKAEKNAILNGLKITTYTKLNKNIIAGPLPMLNPPLLIPLDEKHIKINEFINVEIEYIMGNGIESIKTKYI